MANRADEFRNRNKKLDQLNSQETAKTQQNMFKIMVQMLSRICMLEKQIQDLTPKARIADWRSLATMNVLHELSLVSEDLIVKKGEEVQIQDFQETSDQDDLKRGLVASEGPAQDGMYAILSLRVYKDGKELVQEAIPRSKIEIGKCNMFPEVDESVRGMEVGQVKRFGMKLMDQTDEAEITLIALKKLKETAPEVQKTQEGNSNVEENASPLN